jgi:hypothetical protein
MEELSQKFQSHNILSIWAGNHKDLAPLSLYKLMLRERSNTMLLREQDITISG